MPKISKLTILKTLFLSCLAGNPVYAGDIPADTYFSLAVSDNSHNHYGENLLFLDFEEQKTNCHQHARTVCASRVDENTILLDGQMHDWQHQSFTSIRARVMNNYPLGEHYDAVPTQLKIAAAYDQENIYFLIHYQDANHDASINRNRWVYNGQTWEAMKHVKPNKNAPAAQTNNIHEVLAGSEDEDQLFMMFPIVDQQKTFSDNGLGCGAYCHSNLFLSANPIDSQIGDGVSSMHTAIPDDIADLWHWTATRTRPMNTLKDGYIDYGDESYNGRKVDDGKHAFENNALNKPFRPRYVHKGDYEAGKYSIPGYRTELLHAEDIIEITPEMDFAANVSIPFYIHSPASGSIADVSTAAYFNPENKTWSIELKRKLNTGDSLDRQFLPGINAQAPHSIMVMEGSSERGEKLFKEKACADCHGESGQGTFNETYWPYPRNQRSSAPAIRKATSLNRPRRLMSLAHELQKYEEDPPQALMPFVNLTAQEAEDIASWLQKQFIHRMK
jgi:mono/diheme cytochrome c family protein